MSINLILELLGGATILIAGLFWLLRTTIKSAIDHQLALFKLEHQSEKDRELEEIKATLRKVESIESLLLENRSERYGTIWTLTGSLNLFGYNEKPDIAKLSTEFKNWYFKHILILSQNSKDIYFMIQEIFHFSWIKSISFQRPDDHLLYEQKERPLNVLRELRMEYLGLSIDQQNKLEVDMLEKCLIHWKNSHADSLAQENWVFLQFMLSKFRSSLITDLGFKNEQENKSV